MADDARTPAEASEDFDPYYIWLGIPPQERPINHYRLLGLSVFESHPEVIAAATERQMGYLRTHQLGQHQRLTQEMLNEVARAKVCLLNPEKKAEYDQQLRLAMTPVSPAALPPALLLDDTLVVRPFCVNPATPPKTVATLKRDKMFWPTSLVICGLAVVLLIAAASMVRVRPPNQASGARRDVPRPAPVAGVRSPLPSDRTYWANASYHTAIQHVRDKEWIETENADGKTRFRYVEMTRTPQYIELYLPVRNQWMRIFDTRMDLKRGDKWGWVATGKWQTAQSTTEAK